MFQKNSGTVVFCQIQNFAAVVFCQKYLIKFKEQVNLPEHLGNFCKKNFLAAIGETGTVRFPSFLKRLYSTQHFSGLPVISLFEEIKESAV